MQNEIQAPRYNSILHKLLDMKEGAPAPMLGTDVFPVLVLEADRLEWKFLAGERIASGYAHVPASAGVYGKVSLVNPPDSNVIMVPDEVRFLGVGVASTDYLSMHLDSSVHTGWVDAATERATDTRFGGLASGGVTPTGFIRYTSGSVPGNSCGRWYADTFDETAGNMLGRFNPNIVLSPGTSVQLVSSAVNTVVAVSIRWRERVLVPSETR